MATAIYYQGSEISNVIDGSQRVLKTSNVWMSDDIEIKYNINSILPSLIDRTISSIPSSFAASVTSIGNYAFYSCSALPTASFPNATTIEHHAFDSCVALTTASFPNATTIGSAAFYYCQSLATASFPNATTIGSSAFYYCRSLTAASFPNATSIGNDAFQYCKALSSLYLMESSVASLGGTTVFTNTPMSRSTYLGYFGSIYVPASLLTNYKTATNWSAYSARIVGV